MDKLKLAIVNTWKGGAVHNIMEPLARELNTYEDVECDYLTIRDDVAREDFDRSFEDYDLVHVGYFDNMLKLRNECLPPMTCGVHHIPPHRMEAVRRLLAYCQPLKIVTADPFAQRQLGQMDINGVEVIPYAFDHDRFPKKMDTPDEFAVGFLGCDSGSKRFSIIEQACEELGVKCVGIDRKTQNEEEDFQDFEAILEMYRKTSVYVSAGWNDGGPLPPQEAWLLGRPVITTPVGMIKEMLIEGWNGEFFDGTVEDLKKKILKVRDNNYKLYCLGARNLWIPTVEKTTKQWYKLFKGLIEEQS